MRVKDIFKQGLVEGSRVFYVVDGHAFSGTITKVNLHNFTIWRDDGCLGIGYRSGWLVHGDTENNMYFITEDGTLSDSCPPMKTKTKKGEEMEKEHVGVENFTQVGLGPTNVRGINEIRINSNSVFLGISPYEDGGLIPWVFASAPPGGRSFASNIFDTKRPETRNFEAHDIKESVVRAIQSGWTVFYFENRMDALVFIHSLYSAELDRIKKLK